MSVLSDCIQPLRLDILLDRHCYIDEHMQQLPNLLHLGLTVTTIKNIRCQLF